MPIVDIKGVGRSRFPDDIDKDDIRKFLRDKYFQEVVAGESNSDLLESASKYGAPTGSTVAPYEPSLMEKASLGIGSALHDSGIISNKSGAYQIGKNVAAIGEVLPGVGDVAAVDDFVRAEAKGDNLGMGLAALGVIPLAGDLAGKAGKALKAKYPDLKIGVSETADNIILDKVIVPDKSKGTGTKFMNDLIADADSKGKSIGLTPSSDFGGNKKRLTEFYKRFGFVENKGKNKDFTISESMIRPASQAPVDVASNIKPALPMDEASRMARAKEQGFNVDKKYFHGTDTDIKEIDPSKFGGATRAESARQGFWSASKPSTAESYANHAARDAKVGNMIEDSYKYAEKGDWDKHDELQAAAEMLERESAAGKGQNIMPLYASGNIKKINMNGADFMDEQDYINNQIKDAKANGFDGVEFGRLIDDVGLTGDEADHLIMFNPEKLRSTSAKFDPKNKGSASLLGGLGALGLGVGLSSNKKDDKPLN
jgi:hypothetical protein